VSQDDCLIGANIKTPILDVRHQDLKRVSDNSSFRSVCPACKKGILLVGRDQQTFELLEFDRCILCGQQVRYTDIDYLRKRES